MMTDVHVASTQPLLPPHDLKGELPASPPVLETVLRGRRNISRILDRDDDRLLVIVGPCCIHDLKSAIEYAQRLQPLHDQLADRLCIAMRVYFEKPRTAVGWKGLLNDPHLDGSDDIGAGLRLARQLSIRINEMGIPVATEFLDPIAPQYLADLVSWVAVGARTTESQTHREMASGLSMPVGFKNSTSGDIQVAINAMRSAQHTHSFLGIDQCGRTSILRTQGNPAGHLVMRGGEGGPNYQAHHLEHAARLLGEAGFALPAILVDCSHGNSGKRHHLQLGVMRAVLEQRRGGNADIIGVMIESHLNAGNQTIPDDLAQLRYGISVIDECVGWETTERMLREAAGEPGSAVAKVA